MGEVNHMLPTADQLEPEGWWCWLPLLLHQPLRRMSMSWSHAPPRTITIKLLIPFLGQDTQFWGHFPNKKVGKTTRPFRYDLNQIPYNYTVEVTNRFEGLDVIDRVPEELWMEVCDIIQEVAIKTISKKKKCKKAEWLSEEALQIAEKRREAKGKGEKERYSHLNAEFQRIARRDKKAFLSDQCKEMYFLGCRKVSWQLVLIPCSSLGLSSFCMCFSVQKGAKN